MTAKTLPWAGKATSAAGRPQSFDLVGLLRRILHRPYIPLVGMVLGIALGGTVMHSLNPRYTSSALLLLTPRPPGTFGAQSDLVSLYVDGARVESVLQIIQSADVLGNVVESQHLEDDAKFTAVPSSPLQPLIRRLHLRNLMDHVHLFPRQPPSPDSKEARIQRAIANLARMLKVSREGFTYVIKVSVTTGSGEEARQLAQAVADSYLAEQTRSKSTAAQQDHSWLTSRLAETRKALKESEQSVEAVRQKYGIAATDSGSPANTDEQSIQQTNAELLRAEAEVATQRANYEQAVNVLKHGGDVSTILLASQSQAGQELIKKRDALMQEIAGLAAVDTSANPKVIDAMRDKKALDSVIKAEGVRFVAQLRDRLAIAEARQAALANELAHKTTTATSQSKSEGYIELRDAQRAVEVNRSLYQVFLKKLQEVEQQLSRQDPEARVISPADFPDVPSFPKPIMFLAGGAFLGMVMGAGIALVRPLPEKGFVNPSDLETGLSLTLLGILPRLKPDRNSRVVSPSYVANHLMLRPLSHFSECLRGLRANLHIGMGDGPRVLQVTSATAGEGKTTVAASLAISAALAGVRTVLVDVDVRNPSISELFGLQEREGLLEILQDHRLAREIRTTHGELPLTIIPAGHTLSAPPDIIASRQLPGLIENIRQSYELVILDAPPILAVSDPLVTGNVADATLLVVEFGNTPKRIVEQAVRTLQVAGVPLAGTVLNKVDPSRSGRQVYQYGGYGWYPRSGKKIGIPGPITCASSVLGTDCSIDGNARS